MKFHITNISVRWKTAVPITVLILVVTFGLVLFMGQRAERIVIDSVVETSLSGYRDTVLNALTALMTHTDYLGEKSAFMENIKRVADIKVIRSAAVRRQYPGSEGSAPDPVEQAVMNNGEPVIQELANGRVRGVFAYRASSNLMNRNCLSCHNVSAGDVLGVVSITLPAVQAPARIRSMQISSIIVAIIAALLNVVIIFVVFRITHRPLELLTREIQRRAGKDLKVSCVDSRDEVIMLSCLMDNMMGAFNVTLKKIISFTGNVASAVDLLKTMINRTSEGAQTQTRQTEQVSRVAEQMNDTIADISRNASAASRIADEARTTALTGKSVADDSIIKMNESFSSVVQLGGTVEQLNKKVVEIGSVVDVIKAIADQTNLLALNAAIEAARAGDQGRGFAVVADEVRKLAERTIRATDEVTEKIGSVQAESRETARSMEVASSQITGTTKYIRQVGGALDHIVEIVEQVNDQVSRIAAAVEEQSAASEEVAENVERTSDIAMEIERMSRDVMHEVEIVSSQVDELRKAEMEFSMERRELISLDMAEADHRAWVSRVESHIQGHIALDPSQMANHKTCRLGQWYAGDGKEIACDMESFQALEEPHMLLHKLGTKAILSYDAGEHDEARKYHADMQEQSELIIKLLTNIRQGCENMQDDEEEV